MEIIKQYKILANSIIKCMGINIDEYESEFESTYSRMCDKYIDIMYTDDLSHKFIFIELFDSVLDLIYYICDYINTCEYNEIETDIFIDFNRTISIHEISETSVVEISENDVLIMSNCMDMVSKFSIKACEDYNKATGGERLVDRDHIHEMIVSEIFEFVSLLILFFSIRDYEFDRDIFEHAVFIITSEIESDESEIESNKSEIESNESIKPNLMDSLEKFMMFEIFRDIVFGNTEICSSAISPLFDDVHAKNMLKIDRKDDMFHFKGMKVIKPDYWKDEVDTSPNEEFLAIIDLVYEGVEYEDFLSCV